MDPASPTFLQSVFTAVIAAIAGAFTKEIAGFAVDRLRAPIQNESKQEVRQPGTFRHLESMVLYTVLGVGLVLPLLLILWRWVLGPWQALLVLLFAIASTIGALWVRESVASSRKFSGATDIAILGLFVLGFYVLDNWFPHDLALEDPKTVAENQLLRGRVTGHGRLVYVLLRPLDASGMFVEKAHVPDCHGNWTAIAHFGGGPGTRFYLTAIALDAYTASIVGDVPSSSFLERIAPFRSDAYIVVKNR
jgi:hypothetical protein